MKSAKAALSAAKNVISFPRFEERRDSNELAFLPAALEIVETPPSPIGRTIALIIVAFFCLAIGWSIFGRIDIVASAQGKIIPSGRVKLVQPFEAGVVRAIYVHDGETVKAGQVLIDLDPTMTTADQEHIRSDLIAAQLNMVRLRAALSDSDDVQRAFKPPAGASEGLVAVQRQLLAKQMKEYRAKLASLNDQRAQKEADRNTVTATIAKLEATNPLIKQRVEILRALSDKGLGSKLTYLEALQNLTEGEKELEVQKSRLDEANAALASVVEARDEEVANFHKKLFEELAETERKATGLSGDLAKAVERTKLQHLTTPVDGIVQQLSVHTVGGVVTPAQQLAVIVPSNAALEVEAIISNRDIGFVHTGQDAQIKVNAFNFARYGLFRGHVLNVSQDAVTQNSSPQGARVDNDGIEKATDRTEAQVLGYIARISLDRTRIQVDNTITSLRPGMTVTVDVKTGSRRIISYLLSPLMKYGHDALRER
jgi:membrane fusion protein, hemolysin D